MYFFFPQATEFLIFIFYKSTKQKEMPEKKLSPVFADEWWKATLKEAKTAHEYNKVWLLRMSSDGVSRVVEWKTAEGPQQPVKIPHGMSTEFTSQPAVCQATHHYAVYIVATWF